MSPSVTFIDGLRRRCAWPDEGGCPEPAVNECPVCHRWFCDAHTDENGACLWDAVDAENRP